MNPHDRRTPTDIGADCRRTSANLPDHPNERIKMNSTRKTAVVAGIFFLITEVTAILGMLLYRNSVLSTPQFIVSSSMDDTGVLLGAFLEVLLAIAVVGTGVTLYPIIKKQNEGMALGHVAGRVIEATIITVGAISLLAVVTMRQGLAGTTGPEAVAAATVGQSLVAVHDWTFLFGPKFALGEHPVTRLSDVPLTARPALHRGSRSHRRPGWSSFLRPRSCSGCTKTCPPSVCWRPLRYSPGRSAWRSG